MKASRETKFRLLSLSLGPYSSVLALHLVACATGGGMEEEPYVKAPSIYAMSADHGRVGMGLDFFGTYDLCDTCGIELEIKGTFTPAGQTEGEEVNYRTRKALNLVEPGVLRWGGFGPFCNGFSEQCFSTGFFTGEIRPAIYDYITGERKEASDPLDVRGFEVQPSTFISWLGPMAVECSAPADRIVGPLDYYMCIRNEGFQGESVTYTIEMPRLESLEEDFGRKTLTKTIEPGSSEDCIAFTGPLELPAPPDGVDTYGINVIVQVQATDGTTVANAFDVPVHRPISLVPVARYTTGEILEPIPDLVGGCKSGDDIGRVIGETQTITDTRANLFSESYSQSFLSAQSSGTSTNTGTSIGSDASESGTVGGQEQVSVGGSDGVTNGTSRASELGIANVFSSGDVEVDKTNVGLSFQNTVDVVSNIEDIGSAEEGSTSESGGSVQVVTVNESDVQAYLKRMEKELGISLGADEGLAVSKALEETLQNSFSASASGGFTAGAMNQRVLNTTLNASSGTNSSITGSEGSSIDVSSGEGTQDGTSSSITEQNNIMRQASVTYSDSVARSYGGLCLPHKKCMKFIQPVRVANVKKVVAYNLCGAPSVVGEVSESTWTWNQTIAVGNSCSPFPEPTELPEAKCVVPPCVGQ